ncbi:hypothetical protein XFF6970_210027 [Xanthomonas citri pv. fuscans]|nr:hypothetical protein XFF6970_210027 [Xanthomonas citri pv. fuscans]
MIITKDRKKRCKAVICDALTQCVTRLIQLMYQTIRPLVWTSNDLPPQDQSHPRPGAFAQ